MRPDIVELRSNSVKQWWLRIVSPNGRIRFTSEMYIRRGVARRLGKAFAERYGLRYKEAA